MIIDTSALVAIFAAEPEASSLQVSIAMSQRCLVSAGSWVEFGTVLVRKYAAVDPVAAQGRLASWLRIVVAPLDGPQTAVAVEAYARFGRGSGHPARLNLGDCFAYALAKATGEPLLFKGDDFNHTDLLLAPESAYPR